MINVGASAKIQKNKIHVKKIIFGTLLHTITNILNIFYQVILTF